MSRARDSNLIDPRATSLEQVAAVLVAGFIELGFDQDDRVSGADTVDFVAQHFAALQKAVAQARRRAVAAQRKTTGAK